MSFNKIFKIVSISLFAVSVLVSVLYLANASSKNCLACSLPVCEKIDAATGEKYLAPADDCALTYAEIKQMEEDNRALGLTDAATISECSKECLTYAGNFMWFTIVMVILAAALTLLFSLYVLIVNPKKIKGVVIGIGGIGLILLVSYLLSSDTIPQIIGYDSVITIGEVKLVDTLLFMMYFLFSFAILGIIFTSIIKYIRK